MSEASQIYDRVPVGIRIDLFTVNSCMQFFIGWMKRFGCTNETFYVPLEIKANPNL